MKNIRRLFIEASSFRRRPESRVDGTTFDVGSQHSIYVLVTNVAKHDDAVVAWIPAFAGMTKVLCGR